MASTASQEKRNVGTKERSLLPPPRCGACLGELGGIRRSMTMTLERDWILGGTRMGPVGSRGSIQLT